MIENRLLNAMLCKSMTYVTSAHGKSLRKAGLKHPLGESNYWIRKVFIGNNLGKRSPQKLPQNSPKSPQNCPTEKLASY